MRELGLAIVRGLGKGLVIGAGLGLVLTYALGWPTPVGSLLGYLAAMAAAGTTGIAGGKAPWREGAWLVALLKAIAGVTAGAFLYWVLDVHLDAALPASILGVLSIPERASSAAEDGSTSWIAFAPLSLAALCGVFGLFIELDHLAGDDERGARPAVEKAAKKGEAAPKPRATSGRETLENADTVGSTRPDVGATRRER